MQRRSKPRRKQRDQRSSEPTRQRRHPDIEYRRLSEPELFDYLELEPLDYLDDDVEGPEGEPEVD